jgi:hypothetical protein
MGLETCLGSCDWDKDVSFNGVVVRAYGGGATNAGEEWVVIDETTEEVLVMLGGSGTSSGTVALYWDDCDGGGACGDAATGSCEAAVTMAPSTTTLAPTPAPALFAFGDACTYADISSADVTSYLVPATKVANEELFVATVPSGRTNVGFRISFNTQDANIKAVGANTGTVLLQKASAADGGSWSYAFANGKTYKLDLTVGGMATTMCVDGCYSNGYVDIQGSTYRLKDTFTQANSLSSRGNEW